VRRSAAQWFLAAWLAFAGGCKAPAQHLSGDSPPSPPRGNARPQPRKAPPRSASRQERVQQALIPRPDQMIRIVGLFSASGSWVVVLLEKDPKEERSRITTRSAERTRLSAPARSRRCPGNCDEPTLVLSGANAAPMALVTDSSERGTVLSALSLAGKEQTTSVGRSKEFYWEAGTRWSAWRRAPVPQGILVWVETRGTRRHDCQGPKQDPTCQVVLTNSEDRLRAALFRGGRKVIHTLSPWMKHEGDQVHGVAVASSLAGDVLFWEQGRVHDSKATHILMRFPLEGPAKRLRLSIPFKGRSADQNHLVLLEDGTVRLFRVFQPSSDRPGEVGIFAFDGGGRALAATAMNTQPAWPLSTTSWSCGRDAFLAFYSLDPDRALELRAIRLDAGGQLRDLGAGWRSVHRTPREVSAVNTNLRMFGACQGHEVAVISEMSSGAETGLVFARWTR
jgi:hypothetical protein